MSDYMQKYSTNFQKFCFEFHFVLSYVIEIEIFVLLFP